MTFNGIALDIDPKLDSTSESLVDEKTYHKPRRQIL